MQAGNSFFHQLLIGNGITERQEVDRVTTIAASEKHRVAEKRRRERINALLHTLRTLLLCDSKMDKASLLSKVVQRVKELNQETSQYLQFNHMLIPSEADEIEVTQFNESINGKSLVKASLCCEDRIDLIPELMEILKPLPLSPVKAEIATLGGRMRNVIVLAGEKNLSDESVLLLREALKAMVLRSSYGDGERLKRRRTLN